MTTIRTGLFGIVFCCLGLSTACSDGNERAAHEENDQAAHDGTDEDGDDQVDPEDGEAADEENEPLDDPPDAGRDDPPPPEGDAGQAEPVASSDDPCKACAAPTSICDMQARACRHSVAGTWEGTLSTGTVLRLTATETEIVDVTSTVTFRFGGNSCKSPLIKGTTAAPIQGVPPTAKVYLFAENAANGVDMLVQFESSTTAKASWPPVTNGGLVCKSPALLSFGTTSTVLAAQTFVLTRK